jgi:hypothetical protein
VRPRTRDALLWLAGLGGAVVLLRAALDLLEWLGGYVPATALGTLLVLASAAAVALAALRSRLKDDRAPRALVFTEKHP